MKNDNIATLPPAAEVIAARLALRALLSPTIVRELEHAIHGLTALELRTLEQAADRIAHACTLEHADPWAAMPAERRMES
jgi:hypothetical protein